jgi:hypothetical protein
MADDNTKKAQLESEYNPVNFWFWVGLCLVFTVGLVWSIYDDVAGTPVSQSPVVPAAIVKPVAVKREPASIDIRKIVPGIRVKAFNPEVSDEERAAWEQVDYTRWLTLDILLMDEKNEPIYLTLIRPVEWVIAMDAQEGKQIWLELEELNGRGWGRVMGLSRCRKVLPGDGRVVTGIFSHRVQGLINVHVEGLKEPIGVTQNHPFWSEDRKDFVQAGSLQVGERLRAMVGGPDGGIARVTAISPRGPPGSSEIVYNMEVEGEHAYQVTGLGIVVHNTYRDTFLGPLGAHPELDGVVWVHHAIPRKVLNVFGHIFNPGEIHALENLRGIPIAINRELHLGTIGTRWKNFFSDLERSGITDPNQVRRLIKRMKDIVDKDYGHQFYLL